MTRRHPPAACAQPGIGKGKGYSSSTGAERKGPRLASESNAEGLGRRATKNEGGPSTEKTRAFLHPGAAPPSPWPARQHKAGSFPTKSAGMLRRTWLCAFSLSFLPGVRLSGRSGGLAAATAGDKTPPGAARCL